LGSTIRKEQKPKIKKIYLISGVIINIALIAYFKYADFFIENINSVLKTNVVFLNLVLPLAISFFTFEQIAYLIDCYKKETKKYNFIDYSIFVIFFPQLIAGPIVHHSEMIPQFKDKLNRVINYSNISKGLFIFSIGLFKKVVIADTFAIWATNGFDNVNYLSFFDAWVTSLSYTFQLYFDFSGYTDMAIGAALLFNIKLPINFNSPYKAANIRDFWQRWHITLSRFLRDYLYIPLGGNKNKIYRNIMITFLIGGLWHGAGWLFVFWGFLHGSALIINRLWNKLNYKLPYIISWAITFNFINITWIFFRATEWSDAIKILKGMVGANGISLPGFLEYKLSFLSNYNLTFNKSGAWLKSVGFDTSPVIVLIFLALCFIIILLPKNTYHKTMELQPNLNNLFFSSFAFIIAFLYINTYSEFLYFQF
jgi:D-alanyl-lipoteichoic acid acyltransferase DltB (MBOAT superfamily)